MNKRVNNSTLSAIHRRIRMFLKSKNIDFVGMKKSKLYGLFLAHAPIPQRPEGVSMRNWLVEQFRNGDLRKFQTEKRVSKKQEKKEKKEKRINYLIYLDSVKWKNKREEALNHYGRFCNKCKSSTNLQVHHLTYKTLYNEELEDLMILCKSCHMNLHKEIKQGRKPHKYIFS